MKEIDLKAILRLLTKEYFITCWGIEFKNLEIKDIKIIMGSYSYNVFMLKLRWLILGYKILKMLRLVKFK